MLAVLQYMICIKTIQYKHPSIYFHTKPCRLSSEAETSLSSSLLLAYLVADVASVNACVCALHVLITFQPCCGVLHAVPANRNINY